MIRLLFTVIILFFSSFTSPSAAIKNKSKDLKKSDFTKVYSKFNINNISTFIYNDGDADIHPYGNSGFIFTNGYQMQMIYETGFVWGGKINGEIRVGGSTYISGLQPGKILDNGNAEDPNLESVRVFRVRPNYATANLSKEQNDEYKSETEIRNQYRKDWEEWPAEKGAPYEDRDNNGMYNPNIDIPGIPGADQTLWFVANDLDSIKCIKFHGSPPMGIELQVTVWGYKDIDIIDNTLFKKIILINKSENSIEDMYVSIWNDADLGEAGDDFIGCDTLLNLGYTYNGDDNDIYFEYNPPAVGFNFLQGPIINGNNDEEGRFLGRIIQGKKNLMMTSFPYVGKSDPLYHEPLFNNYENGTLWWYNLMQGLNSINGEPFIDPLTNKIVKFTHAGDPISGSGWVDGILRAPGDRRFAMNSGPFTMAVGDTQEVIFAEIAAGGEENTDRLEAVKLLKLYNSLAQEFYDYHFVYFPNYKLISPVAEKTELDREVIISWYNDSNLKNIENNSQLSFNFQGYSVYQYPDKHYNQNEAIEIVTYDLNDGIAKIISESTDFSDNSKIYEVVKYGSDSGLKRHISITKDYFSGNLPLNNGTEYYFGVSAYCINQNLLFHPPIIESEPYVFSVIPQYPKPGNFYEGNYGDQIKVIQTNGISNFKINIKVVNPTELTGKTYKMLFNGDANLEDINYSDLKITINDEDGNSLIKDKKIIIQNNVESVNPIVVDGLEIEPFNLDTLVFYKLSPGEEFIFKSPEVIFDDLDLAEEQIGMINIFPNPFYGFHVNELNQYDKFVTITHLPNKAKIRIFNLGGQLVNTLEKNDNSQFIKWNLTNGRNFWVTSGIYIIYIEMPELNKTKVLKLAVIMENIVPDYF